MNPVFWQRKRVLLTGHTGFKGSWLALWLAELGAEVTGYALAPPTAPSLFHQARVRDEVRSVSGDVLDGGRLRRVVRESAPEVVFHLAAQALVRRSYADPVGTFAVNALGTARLLDVLRDCPSARAVVIVTSDKCYENEGNGAAHAETDPLGGRDPYSASKACAEIVTAAFRRSFFESPESPSRAGVASARAGNVIGGGDWAADRLVPDVVRAALGGAPALVRHPNAVRPWQHVLEPLSGYLRLAERLCDDPERFAGSWNFGPEESDAVPVAELLGRIGRHWGPELRWRPDGAAHPWEAPALRLDCRKARSELQWRPRWDLERAVEETVRWYKAYQQGNDLRALCREQIRAYQQATVPSAVPAR